MIKKIVCVACALGRNPKCHECGGKGFIEYREGCVRHFPECPMEDEGMVPGWICTKCGDSGPYSKVTGTLAE